MFSDNLLQTANVIILKLSTEGKIIYFNPYPERLTGYLLDEVKGKDWFEIFTPKYAYKSIKKEFQKTLHDINIQGNINPIVIKNNDELLIEWHNTNFKDELGDVTSFLSIGMDITKLKNSEIALKGAVRAYKILSAVNLSVSRAKSENTILQEVVDAIVTQGEYSFASVYYIKNSAKKYLSYKVSSGIDKSFFCEKEISIEDIKNATSPSVKAINTSTILICKDINESCISKEWKDKLVSKNYISTISLPLFDKNRVFGVLNIYSRYKENFNQEELKLLEDVAEDFAYGILALRNSIEHEKHALELRKSLEQYIQTIAMTLESRDPYTAGHQRRVSELAVAIAKELKLTSEQIDGIHFASIIHDLGKIRIPAEILSKPGKLSDIEFKLIQIHAQAGYDIIKDVQFPWPIADMILQHHEKIDGSGYPQGLKGNQIMLEAKIITVADIVEAMSSHRPYRAALGIDIAIKEIQRGRGIQYDEDAVDACIKLFKERKFKFMDK
ncbi:MAG: HD domain-containing phosphohydrolase [Poseidonibacter sp.]|uniref:HD domain-containing phosphohydrolase n=1 Tax=Poseidonibacter sp. TaxID=2321188 RepID=UPI00359E4E84